MHNITVISHTKRVSFSSILLYYPCNITLDFVNKADPQREGLVCYNENGSSLSDGKAYIQEISFF